jgi:hypothetical protein
MSKKATPTATTPASKAAIQMFLPRMSDSVGEALPVCTVGIGRDDGREAGGEGAG